MNLRAKIWVEGGRKFFDKRVCLGDDKILNGQLLWPKILFAENARQKISSKKEMKEERADSPDRADCLMDGLYAIERAERLDAKEYRESTENRQGHGTPLIEDFQESLFVGGRIG